MQLPFVSLRPDPTRGRGRAVGLVAVGLLLGALSACGSSNAGADVEPTEFCTAVRQYVDATNAGDRTSSADKLAASVDGLPEEARRTMEAYVLALRGAPASHPTDADGVTSARTQESFETYVAEVCGEDAISSAAETTTTVTMADTSTTVAAGDQGTGTDGSTGDQGTDSQADGTGSGGNSSVDGGMDSGGSSGGATG